MDDFQRCALLVIALFLSIGCDRKVDSDNDAGAKRPVAVVTGPGKAIDPTAVTEEILGRYVDASVQLLNLTLADSDKQAKRYNPDCPVGPFDWKTAAPLYRFVRRHAIVAAANALREARGQTGTLSNADFDGVLQANRRAVKTIAERLVKEEDTPSRQQVAKALRQIAEGPSEFPDHEAVEKKRLELCFGERAEEARKASGPGVWSTTSLAMLPIVELEIEACSRGLNRDASLDKWGIAAVTRDDQHTVASGNYCAMWRKLGKTVAPNVYAALRRDVEERGVEKCFMKDLPEVTGEEKKSPNVSFTLKRGEMISPKAPFQHSDSIWASSMHCSTEYSPPGFLDIDVGFAGWQGKEVRFDLTIKAKPDAPLGRHFFRMYHDGAYESDGVEHPIIAKRVVEVTITE